jgi:uncharacterized damage-inducible protein DinB
MPNHTSPEADIRPVLLETYAASGRMNQLLLKHIDERAWRAKPPGLAGQDFRTIAAIFAHMHNNRLVWLKRSASHLRCPSPLDPIRCSVRATAAAHRSSDACCQTMLKQALSVKPSRRVTTFSRGSWATEWPAGATMFAYMFAHEAHHRGQVLALAHQVGYCLPESVANGIWDWDSLWKQLGCARGPR